MTTTHTRTGGQLVVNSLEQQGITRLSCVPGESFLPVLDALLDSSIEVDVARHEAGAGNMALAVAKLTGRAGVVLTSRGPGSMHAAVSVHTAEQDAIPLVMMVGQVALRDRGRGGFQEVSYQQVFGSMAKWVVSLDTVERIPETVARAIRIAETGRPGPVVIEMPEDILSLDTQVADVGRVSLTSPAPANSDIDLVAEMLSHAKRPLLVIGRGPWSRTAAESLELFATRYDIPVLSGFRCQDYIDNLSPVYAGHLGFNIDSSLRRRIDSADFILGLGGHFGDVETQGYGILQPREDLKVVHVAHSEHDLDRFLQADLALTVDPREFIQGMLERPKAETNRFEWVSKLREEETRRSTPSVGQGDPLADILGWLQQHMPADAIIANGAGNYAVWVHKFHRYRTYGTQLAPASGAMGFGLPAGIAASRVRPTQPVIVFGGDGCFTMALPELSTLVGSKANITMIVINNGSYGTIRLHQEKKYPARVSATDISNPDFVSLAKSYGFAAERVHNVDQFAKAFTELNIQGGPRLIEVILDPNQFTPDILLKNIHSRE